MPSDAQIVFRAETALKVELEAVSETLDVSSAKLLRDLLAEALPQLRKKADAEAARRAKLPAGVTREEVEKALLSHLRAFARGESLHIGPRDLLTPAGKALWVFLGFIWRDDKSEADRKAADKLAGIVSRFKDEGEGTGKKKT
ncbi:MAG: hypothetical protein JWO38_2707 [Gemmataceae bacterium]|nr:hypothetical protein [Gemmataceae bacterium]